MKGKEFRFTTIKRSICIFVVVELILREWYARPKCKKDYRVNINDLFDRDDHFLYENKMFKGLLRRISNHHGHLINTSYDIDGSILKANEPIDNYINDPKNRTVKHFTMRDDFTQNIMSYNLDETFNMPCLLGKKGRKAQNPFEATMAKYDAFFGNETTILHQKIEIMNQKKDLMLRMRNAIKGLEMERQVEHEFRVGQILIDQYRHYKKF